MSELEKQYARTFASIDGQCVLKHLRSLTIERTVGQNITDNELRWLAAKSALVHYIENLINKGNNPK